MRSDQVQRNGTDPEDSGDAESGAREVPRHATPRKPLLTRLQMPAGKAIALAAMPTAVLMGMGLTPTLAQAKPVPNNPFSDGPCITKADEAQQDKAEEQKAAEAKKKADEAKKKQEEADRKADEAKDRAKKDDGGKASPSPSPSASGSGGGSTGSSGTSGSSGSSGTSGTGSGGLLGGLGSALGGLLDPGGRATASPSPSPSPSVKDSGSADDPVGKVTGSLGDTVDEVTGTVGDTADKAGDAVGDVTKPSASPSPSPSATGADGKPAFPCVVEKKSSGTDENTPALLPNEGWRLEASSLLAKGLHYGGVVNLRTQNGEVKQALKYTSTDGVDIGDLHQIVPGPVGKQYHVMAAAGSTSTFRDGTVTMYMESLSGNLFGVIPITFDPEHPPPVDLPVAYFTNVHITFAGLFGSTLTVPGLHNYITD